MSLLGSKRMKCYFISLENNEGGNKMTQDIIIHKTVFVFLVMTAVILWNTWKPVSIMERITRTGMAGLLLVLAAYFAITAPPA